MTNFDRIMEKPLKKLWQNLSPECLSDMIAGSDVDCVDCPFAKICDVDKTDHTCYGFILEWLESATN